MQSSVEQTNRMVVMLPFVLFVLPCETLMKGIKLKGTCFGKRDK